MSRRKKMINALEMGNSSGYSQPVFIRFAANKCGEGRKRQGALLL
jgi:hypothetical protein